MLLTATARADSITLAWDPNTEADLAGYLVLYGTSSRTYTTTVDVGNTPTWTVCGLTAGQMHFVALKA